MKKTYRLPVPGYNANGGGDYPKISHLASYVNTGFVDAEVLKDFLQKSSPIDVNAYSPEGEIKYQ